MNSIDKRTERNDNVFFAFSYNQIVAFYMVCFSINYIFKYYLTESLYAGFVYSVSFSFLLISLFYSKFRITVRNYFEIYYLFVYIHVWIMTIINFNSSGASGGKAECAAIYLPIFTAFLFKNLKIETLGKVFRLIGIIAVFLFLFILSRTNINVVAAINRGYQWQEIFYYTGLFCFAVPLVVYSYLTQEKLWLSVIVLTSEVVLHLIIVKRMILVDVGVLIALIILITLLKKNKLANVWHLTIVFLIIGGAVIFYYNETLMTLFDSVFNRTLEVAEDGTFEFNRFQESVNFYKNASFFEILCGKGFSASHWGLGKAASALHMGWNNFILKGGLPLFFLSFIPCFCCLGMLKNFDKYTLKTQFSIVFLLFMFPKLFLANMHGFEPVMFLFYYCCIEVMFSRTIKFTSKVKKKKC